MAVGAVKSNHIHDRAPGGGKQDLPDAQHGRAGMDGQQFGDACAGRCSVHFLVGVVQFDIVFALDGGE